MVCPILREKRIVRVPQSLNRSRELTVARNGETRTNGTALEKPFVLRIWLLPTDRPGIRHLGPVVHADCQQREHKAVTASARKAPGDASQRGAHKAPLDAQTPCLLANSLIRPPPSVSASPATWFFISYPIPRKGLGENLGRK